MSVYKELLYAMKEVEESSVRIYPDACDFGVPVKTKEDPIIKMVAGIRKQYDGITTTETYSTGATQTITIKGYDELRTRRPFTAKFVFTTTRNDKSGRIGYLTIESNLN